MILYIFKKCLIEYHATSITKLQNLFRQKDNAHTAGFVITDLAEKNELSSKCCGYSFP